MGYRSPVRSFIRFSFIFLLSLFFSLLIFFLIIESPFEFRICGEFALRLITHLENISVVSTYL
jgi:hypothetical protein